MENIENSFDINDMEHATSMLAGKFLFDDLTWFERLRSVLKKMAETSLLFPK